VARNESVRMAAALRELLVQRGGGNFSAATRAYIYIGMAAAGDDLSPFTKDIRLLLCEPLAQPVHDQLQQLIPGRPTPVLQLSYTPLPAVTPPVVPLPAAPSLDTSDSYEVGFEF
jgi:hypothetical protein